MNRLRTESSRISAPSVFGVLAFTAALTIAAWWAVQLSAPRAAIAPAAQPTAALSDPAPAASMFGSPSQAAKAGVDPRLASVKVVGVFVHNSRGAALLAVNGAAPRAYAVGDQVASGLTLRDVTADSAVFERLGERIVLPAPRRTAAELLNTAPAQR